MVHNDVANDYFEWMYHLVCNERHYNKLSYKKLLKLLNDISFYSLIDLDENRRVDGLYFRYEYGKEYGYSYEDIDNLLGDKPCSVLEVMIALANRVETNIMDDFNEGNRLGQWFWSMIVSLDLGRFDDQHFDYDQVLDIVDRFLHREYEPDGRGGLFTLKNPPQDLRDVEIWVQCMWYLNEVIEEKGGYVC